MQGLIDLLGLIGGGDVGADVAAHGQAIRAQQLADAQLARQMQAQKALEAARADAIANPSAKAFNTLMTLDPASHEAITQQWKAKDADTQKTELAEASSIRGYLRAGRPDLARKVVQRRIDATKKAGQPTDEDEDYLELIDEDPDSAAGHADYMIASAIGPDKWEAAFGKIDDGRRADTKLPAEVGKLVAETANQTADAALKGEQAEQVAPNARSARQVDQARVADIQSQITTRAETLGLERDKLETTTNLELERLQLERDKTGRVLSGPSETAMTNSVVAAEGSRALASQADALATEIEGAELSGGWGAWMAKKGQVAFGNPNLLRKHYTTLINSQAVKNLPPGPASDKDIQLALEGYPAATANAATMASFLRGVAKMQNIQANREQARADWISDNGNLGKAKHDITVNGVKVPAGSNWLEFSNSQAAVERREAVSERSYMRFGAPNGSR